MQIVIDIPEESYIALMEIKEALQRSQGFEKFIVNGTPLPTGHGRLIDADALELDYDWYEYTTSTGQLVTIGYQAYSLSQIENAKTIIEADGGDGNTWCDIPADEMSVSQLRVAVKDLRKILAEVINNAN